MQIRHLTFRLLEVYIALVRQGSVTGAARQLHLTQPTVSQQLKRLTASVGEPLLVQQQGRLQPTQAGAELYRTALDVLGRFEDFQEYLGELRGGLRGRFSLALVNTAQYVLPRLLGPFRQAYPEVDFTLNIGNRQHIMQRLEKQLDDIYVFSHPPNVPHIESAPFLNNPLVMIAPSTHARAQDSQIGIRALLNENFLLREPGSATRMLLDSWLHSQGVQIGQVLQMASNEAIRVGVAAGLGIAVVSRHVLPPVHPDIQVLDVQGLPIQSHWHFVIRSDRRLPYAASGFLQFTATWIQTHADPQLGTGLNQLWQKAMP